MQDEPTSIVREEGGLNFDVSRRYDERCGRGQRTERGAISSNENHFQTLTKGLLCTKDASCFDRSSFRFFSNMSEFTGRF